jgi:hypothetical protein
LEEVIAKLDQLALVSKESVSGPATNAHKFINYELEFDLNNPNAPTEEEITSMLDERGDAIDNELIEEVDNVQISDVVVNRASLNDQC